MIISELMWNSWQRNWEKILQIAQNRHWDYNELMLSSQASEVEVNSVEDQIGFQLPEDFRSVLTSYAAEVSFSYVSLEEAPTDKYKHVWSGGADFIWSLDNILKLFEQVRYRCKSGKVPDYWLEMIPFQDLLYGQYLAFDTRSTAKDTPVVYLDNNDLRHYPSGPNLDGKVVAKSFTEFISNWSELGCPGNLDSFYINSRDEFSLQRESHREWLKWIGITGNELSGKKS